MINYTLPDFTVGLGLNLFFIRLLEQRPGAVQDGVRIDSVYGCFPACDLNGGRAVLARASHASADGGGVLALGRARRKGASHATNMLADEDDLHDEVPERDARHRQPLHASRPSCTPTSWATTCASVTACAACCPPRARWRTQAEVNRMTKRYDYVVARLQPPQGSGVSRGARRPRRRWRSW